MVELFADLLLSFEAVIEERIGLYFRVGDFDGYQTPALQVGCLVNGRHTAAGNQIFQAVMIELGAGME
jgi:hypothetical protein